MGGFFFFLKRRAALIALCSAAILLLVGVAAFGLALRRCRIDLDPGAYIRWRLEQRVFEVPERGAEPGEEVRRWEKTLEAYCIGPDNEVLLVVGGDGDRVPELHHLRWAAEGRVDRHLGPDRLIPEGVPVGFFDFNLLPLPEGLEQRWQREVTWAYLPPGRRRVEASVQRVRNGVRPEFDCRLPIVEWPDAVPGRPAEQRYVRLSDIRCGYRFDSLQGVVDHARLRLRIAVEQPEGSAGPGIERYAAIVELHLEDVGSRRDPDLTRLARALLACQRDLEGGAPPAAMGRHAAALAEFADGGGTSLERLAAGMVRRLRGGVGEGTWAVRVATASDARRSEIERLRLALVADGFPAFIRERDDLLVVYAGPFAGQDRHVLEAIDDRYGDGRPHWERIE